MRAAGYPPRPPRDPGNLPRLTGDEQIEPDETPDLHGAYPRLSTEQVRSLRGAAASARSGRPTCSSESATGTPTWWSCCPAGWPCSTVSRPDARLLRSTAGTASSASWDR